MSVAIDRGRGREIPSDYIGGLLKQEREGERAVASAFSPLNVTHSTAPLVRFPVARSLLLRILIM